jgi:hypothetical protein
MSIRKIDFHAQWDQTNSHLRTPLPTTAQKARKVAWNILSFCIPFIGIGRLIGYAVGCLANRMTLPASHMSAERIETAKVNYNHFWKGPLTDKNHSIRSQFSAEEHTVITPDEAALNVKLIRHKDANAATPTIIYFNGNNQLALANSIPPWIISQSIERQTPCNFVFFDYRGVGSSKGVFKGAKDLVVDGSSVVQWVRDYLQTPPSHIHFYGHSLGGAVATQTQALDPDQFIGRHLNTCSFSSSDKMIACLFGEKRFGKFINTIFKNQGYSADSAAAFQKLKGQKLVVYHPHDEVIPFAASLQNAVHHDPAIALQPRPRWESLSKELNHNAPMEWHETDGIAQFLFGR